MQQLQLRVEAVHHACILLRTHTESAGPWHANYTYANMHACGTLSSTCIRINPTSSLPPMHAWVIWQRQGAHLHDAYVAKDGDVGEEAAGHGVGQRKHQRHQEGQRQEVADGEAPAGKQHQDGMETQQPQTRKGLPACQRRRLLYLCTIVSRQLPHSPSRHSTHQTACRRRDPLEADAGGFATATTAAAAPCAAPSSAPAGGGDGVAAAPSCCSGRTNMLLSTYVLASTSLCWAFVELVNP